MRVKLSLPIADAEKLREKIVELAEKVEHDETGEADWEAIILIDPGQFRVINDLLQKECKGRGRLETLTFAAASNANPSAST